MMKKIVVVDDDAAILEVMQIILETNGCEVMATNDTSDLGKIVQKIVSFGPDVVFLDIWMPGCDGKQITRTLKSQDATKHIAVILVSALNEAGAIAKEVGADSYLHKPFDMDALVAIANKF